MLNGRVDQSDVSAVVGSGLCGAIDIGNALAHKSGEPLGRPLVLDHREDLDACAASLPVKAPLLELALVVALHQLIAP